MNHVCFFRDHSRYRALTELDGEAGLALSVLSKEQVENVVVYAFEVVVKLDPGGKNVGSPPEVVKSHLGFM